MKEQTVLASKEFPGLASHIAYTEKCCFSEPWSEKAVTEFLSYPYNHVLVAQHEDVFAGYITYTQIADEMQIANVAVLPEFRRKGLADRLLAALFALAENEHIAKISLEVRSSNAPARALYEKNGFIAVGSRRGYYKNPTEDALLYDKNFAD